MFRLGFSRLGEWTEAEFDAQYPILLEAYAGALDVHTRLYPGAAEAVERLRAQGYATAICTNKPEMLAETLVQRLGVRGLFGRWSGPIRCPCASQTRRPCTRCCAASGPGRAGAADRRHRDRPQDWPERRRVPVVLVTFGPEGQGVARLSPEALRIISTNCRRSPPGCCPDPGAVRPRLTGSGAVN